MGGRQEYRHVVHGYGSAKENRLGNRAAKRGGNCDTGHGDVILGCEEEGVVTLPTNRCSQNVLDGACSLPRTLLKAASCSGPGDGSCHSESERLQALTMVLDCGDQQESSHVLLQTSMALGYRVTASWVLAPGPPPQPCAYRPQATLPRTAGFSVPGQVYYRPTVDCG